MESSTPPRPEHSSEAPTCEVPLHVFRELFERSIRVWLNWNEIFDRNLRPVVEFATTLDVFSSDYFPWYVSETGHEVDFSDDARPVALRDFPSIEAALRPERRKRIQELRSSIGRGTSGLQLVVPAYALERGRLILDGCHRLAALAGTDVSMGAVILTLEGPIDSAILPDLAHWQRHSAF